MDFCCGRGGTDRLTEREGRVSAKPIGGERGWVEEFKRSFKPYSRKRKKIWSNFVECIGYNAKRANGQKWEVKGMIERSEKFTDSLRAGFH